MAALAYVLLPVTGLVAFFAGDERARAHGFQAVVMGVAWPLLLYLCSLVSSGVTQIAFVAGAALWLFMIVATALGRDPKLPLVGTWVSRREGT